ncbi:NAD(P)H-binding protein [Lacinutrix neustonica]|uniref:NAD(P)H-binding protein n=1 Tax=Lacinutrix neustonica TaxID=2980107 RepID=A0A9E8MTY0_9FLAO|nr:NAD(P)H-binding protein [Lacinutrix neustonica]WAC00909.1 NAD(P)H-binding protein [Lacinutrix neustonica]
MSKSAIILGATGLTGGILLQQLLKDARYSKIILFSRNTCGINHVKIQEHLIDLFQLETYKKEFVANDVFCCIGTTKAKTKDNDQYTKIDYGIPVAAAHLSAENGIENFIVISALGADANSKLFYNRTKGLMENKVLSEKIKQTYVLQPALIGGQREEKRLGEYVAKIVMTLVNPFLIGRLKKYKSIAPKTIVNAMVWLANHRYESGRIESDVIQQLGKD